MRTLLWKIYYRMLWKLAVISILIKKFVVSNREIRFDDGRRKYVY